MSDPDPDPLTISPAFDPQDDNNLREALKQGSLMLGELRTIALSPQKYYELYMQVWNELRHLEAFFGEKDRHGKSNLELYELVQHAGNILPRLYLLITVGAVYIKSKEGGAKDVLRDLVEMAKGVQQPIHGLFLRTYLSQASKTLLPDTGSEYEGSGGDVNDAVEFVLQNFTEMNKLWVRMQHGGGNRDRERREKERRELRDLVGKNLLVLTQLEGMTLELYKGTVLPRVLEQVINCKDDIAQPYLLDALIQVFPDEFHVRTLDAFLEACPLLKPSVKIGVVLASLMDRLASAAQGAPEMVAQFTELDAFGKLSGGCASVVASQPSMDAHDRLQMHAALMGFVTAVHRDRLDYVDGVLCACADALNAAGGEKKEKAKMENTENGENAEETEEPGPPMIVSDNKGVRQLHALLTVPLDTYDVVSVLGLSNYPRVMSLLQPVNLRRMARTIVESVIRAPDAAITDAAQAETLFRFISILVKDGEGGMGTSDDVDDEDFEEEQNLVARLVHATRSDDGDTQYRLLVASRKHFGQGGPRRLRHTLPPLAHEAMRLGRSLIARAREDGADAEGAEGGAAAAAAAAGPMGPALKKILQFLHQTVSALADAPVSRHEPAMRLFLEAALLADAAGMEPIAYEFFEKAMTIYEDEISDSAAQRSALACIAGTLHQCVGFTAESRDALVHKTTAYSARLLKKPDQVRAVADCAHLFWGPEDAPGAARDAASVVTCLKKALKIAGGVQAAAVGGHAGGGDALALFIEVLNKYLYFFDAGCPSVDASVLQGLLEIINGELAGEEHGVTPDIQAYYGATVRHIKHQKLKGGEIGARYEAISL